MREPFLPGSKVLFYGDSITDWFRDKEDGEDLGHGYAARVAGAYRALFGEGVRFINRGVSGNRIGDLLARYEDDVLSIRPDVISILIGVNDTWRRYDRNDPTPADIFEERYFQLLQNIRTDLPDCRILMVEPFLLHEPGDRWQWHEDLDPKRLAVCRLAQKYADWYLPMQAVFTEEIIRTRCSESSLLYDGVHPTEKGQALIAVHILKIWGIF